jgi:putative hydrolase of HD superfamily
LHPLSRAEKVSKRRREHDAYLRIVAEFVRTLPWVPDLIARYEARANPEARYVKALDKLLPKITHIANDLATIREHGLTSHTLAARYDQQTRELRAYAADFPALFELRAELVGQVLARFGPVGRAIA